MPDLLSYNATELLVFVLVLVRISGIVLASPVFGSTNIPRQVQIALILLLSVLLYPVLATSSARLGIHPDHISHYILLVFSELLIGVVIGLVGKMMFTAVEFAGTMTGFQMGLSMANVVNPQSNEQSSLIGQFEFIVASLVFLVMDAHLVIIQAMARSYDLIPLGAAEMNEDLAKQIVTMSSGIFSIGLQLGAPLIVSLFLANVIMGLLARSVPQIQVFIVGFPLTLMLGFLFLWLGMPHFIQALRMMFQDFDNQLLQILHLLNPP